MQAYHLPYLLFLGLNHVVLTYPETRPSMIFLFVASYLRSLVPRFHEKACQPIVRRGERLLSVIPNVTLPSAFFYELSHKLDALYSPSWKLQPYLRSFLCHWLMTDPAKQRSLPDGTLSLGSYK